MRKQPGPHFEITTTRSRFIGCLPIAMAGEALHPQKLARMRDSAVGFEEPQSIDASLCVMSSSLSLDRNPHSGSIPPRWRTVLELPRMALAVAKLPFYLGQLLSAPAGRGKPVLVIPGFATTDRSTALLRWYLSHLGYQVSGWQLGRNLGAKTIGVHNERLARRLDEICYESGSPVSIIGWSMGGIMARMIARAAPAHVSRVVSLGAPFTGDPFANHSWQIYERMSGHSLAHPIAQAQIAESKKPMPVPSISIYSKSDGIVDWQCCIEPHQPSAHNIEVNSAHCGFGFEPLVLRKIADMLALTMAKGADN